MTRGSPRPLIREGRTEEGKKIKIRLPKRMKGKPSKRPKPGAKTKYKGSKDDKLVKNYCLLGATNKELGELLGVGERTVERWIRVRPSFRRAVMNGRAIADANVARGIYRRAKGHTHKAIKMFQSEGQILTKEYKEYYPPDPSAGKFWLINRRKNDWREHSSSEVFGAGGGPIQINISDTDTKL